MGWPWERRRRPAEDAVVDELCRLLRDRPWEWAASVRKPSQRLAGVAWDVLRHVSGVAIVWHFATEDFRISNMRDTDSTPAGEVRLAARYRGQLVAAVTAHHAAKVARPVVPFSDAAREMAKAVLAGDQEAARALADLVCEAVARAAAGGE